jgi:hypothetical protein
MNVIENAIFTEENSDLLGQVKPAVSALTAAQKANNEAQKTNQTLTSVLEIIHNYHDEVAACAAINLIAEGVKYADDKIRTLNATAKRVAAMEENNKGVYLVIPSKKKVWQGAIWKDRNPNAVKAVTVKALIATAKKLGELLARWSKQNADVKGADTLRAMIIDMVANGGKQTHDVEETRGTIAVNVIPMHRDAA